MSVLIYPSPELRQKSEIVREIDDELYEKAQQIKDEMYEYNAYGISAPQVGVNKRLITVNENEFPNLGHEILVNPKITYKKNIQKDMERCLSLPKLEFRIKRYDQITVKAFTIRGKKVEFKLDGLISRVFQHEIDHLDGKLILDKAKRKEIDKQQAELDHLKVKHKKEN